MTNIELQIETCKKDIEKLEKLYREGDYNLAQLRSEYLLVNANQIRTGLIKLMEKEK